MIFCDEIGCQSNDEIAFFPLQHSPSSFQDDNEDDDDDIKTDDSAEIERKRKKSKKTKKKKNKKKKKRKRNKSISSVENISDNDSMLDDDLNLTPPIRNTSPAHWDKRYTPNRTNTLSKSPMTPPIRPNSNMSIYSDTGNIWFNAYFEIKSAAKTSHGHSECGTDFLLCLFRVSFD